MYVIYLYIDWICAYTHTYTTVNLIQVHCSLRHHVVCTIKKIEN